MAAYKVNGINPFQQGLIYRMITGVSSTNITYVEGATPGITGYLTGYSDNFTTINTALDLTDLSSSYTIKWIGYFVPKLNGRHSFSMTSSDANKRAESGFWINNSIVSFSGRYKDAISNANKTVVNSPTAKTVDMSAGDYYYTEIFYSTNSTSTHNLQFSFTDPNQTTITNGEGYYVYSNPNGINEILSPTYQNKILHMSDSSFIMYTWGTGYVDTSYPSSIFNSPKGFATYSIMQNTSRHFPSVYMMGCPSAFDWYDSSYTLAWHCFNKEANANSAFGLLKDAKRTDTYNFTGTSDATIINYDSAADTNSNPTLVARSISDISCSSFNPNNRTAIQSTSSKKLYIRLPIYKQKVGEPGTYSFSFWAKLYANSTRLFYMTSATNWLFIYPSTYNSTTRQFEIAIQILTESYAEVIDSQVNENEWYFYGITFNRLANGTTITYYRKNMAGDSVTKWSRSYTNLDYNWYQLSSVHFFYDTTYWNTKGYGAFDCIRYYDASLNISDYDEIYDFEKNNNPTESLVNPVNKKTNYSYQSIFSFIYMPPKKFTYTYTASSSGISKIYCTADNYAIVYINNTLVHGKTSFFTFKYRFDSGKTYKIDVYLYNCGGPGLMLFYGLNASNAILFSTETTTGWTMTEASSNYKINGVDLFKICMPTMIEHGNIYNTIGYTDNFNFGNVYQLKSSLRSNIYLFDKLFYDFAWRTNQVGGKNYDIFEFTNTRTSYFIVPYNGSLNYVCVGGGGGSGALYYLGDGGKSAGGGAGRFMSGTFPVFKGQVIEVYVGKGGISGRLGLSTTGNTYGINGDDSIIKLLNKFIILSPGGGGGGGFDMTASSIVRGQNGGSGGGNSFQQYDLVSTNISGTISNINYSSYITYNLGTNGQNGSSAIIGVNSAPMESVTICIDGGGGGASSSIFPNYITTIPPLHINYRKIELIPGGNGIIIDFNILNGYDSTLNNICEGGGGSADLLFTQMTTPSSTKLNSGAIYKNSFESSYVQQIQNTGCGGTNLNDGMSGLIIFTLTPTT